MWRAKEMHRELLKVRHGYETSLSWLRTEQSLANMWREKLQGEIGISWKQADW